MNILPARPLATTEKGYIPPLVTFDLDVYF